MVGGGKTGHNGYQVQSQSRWVLPAPHGLESDNFVGVLPRKYVLCQVFDGMITALCEAENEAQHNG